MKAFHFELDKLLRLRSHAADDARQALGRAVSARNEIALRLAALDSERNAAAARRFEPERGPDGLQSLGAAMRLYDAYIEKLDADTSRLVEEAAKAEEAVNEAREAYLKAESERKALDKLQEKRLGLWRKERFAQEEKAAEESRPRSDDLS